MFEEGHYLVGVLALIVVEGLTLSFVARRTQRAFRFLDIVFHLGAGAFLVLAVWSAERDLPWWVTAALVTASLPVHLVDLGRRWVATEPTT